MMKFKLEPCSEYQRLQCDLFANHVYDSNKKTYAARGSSVKEKVIADIFNGKIAECQVFNFLEADGYKPSPIDFTIYSRRRKTFDCDTKIDGFRVHIKSCQGGSKYPNSWLFQKTDPVVSMRSEEDLLILCVLGEEDIAYSILASDVTFRDPVLLNLARTKTAVYEDDLFTLSAAASKALDLTTF